MELVQTAADKVPPSQVPGPRRHCILCVLDSFLPESSFPLKVPILSAPECSIRSISALQYWDTRLHVEVLQLNLPGSELFPPAAILLPPKGSFCCQLSFVLLKFVLAFFARYFLYPTHLLEILHSSASFSKMSCCSRRVGRPGVGPKRFRSRAPEFLLDDDHLSSSSRLSIPLAGFFKNWLRLVAGSRPC